MIAYTRGMMLQGEAHQMETDEAPKRQVEAKYFQAIEQYNSAVHFDPKLADAFYRRGVCREQIKQHEAAVSDFTQALALQPHKSDIYNRRAFAYKEMQKWKEAIADFDAVERLAPKFPQALLHRAYCKLYLEDGQGALADAQKLLALEKDQYYSYELLGSAYRQLGKDAEAQAAYDKALELAPDSREVYINRGYSNLVMGRYAPAVADFRSHLRLSKWGSKETAPYAVLLGYFAAKLDKNDVVAKQFMDEGYEHYNISKEIDKGAHNARVADQWPLPALQYMNKDITRDAFVRAAQGDTGRETEMQCYLGIESLINGDKRTARVHLSWVVQNGRRDFVEWEIAKRLLAKT